MLASKVHRHPSAELFLRRRLVAPELDEGTASRMQAEVLATLDSYLEGEGLAFPMTAHTLTARA